MFVDKLKGIRICLAIRHSGEANEGCLRRGIGFWCFVGKSTSTLPRISQLGFCFAIEKVGRDFNEIGGSVVKEFVRWVCQFVGVLQRTRNY